MSMHRPEGRSKSCAAAPTLSRRSALRFAALTAVMPGALLTIVKSAFAQQKAPKSAAMYQAMPMNGEQCSGCLHFQPGGASADPATCEVVAGEVAPNGWCSIFAAKP